MSHPPTDSSRYDCPLDCLFQEGGKNCDDWEYRTHCPDNPNHITDDHDWNTRNMEDGEYGEYCGRVRFLQDEGESDFLLHQQQERGMRIR